MVARGWSAAQKQAYLIANNKLALNANWDEALLSIELADLKAMGADLKLVGFDDDELAALLADSSPGLTDPDEVPEPLPEAVPTLSDVWILGRHRLAHLIHAVGRGIRPIAHVGRRINVPTSPRNRAASGQWLANASRTRLAVSLICTAILNNRSRMVENSPLASGCGPGMALRTSQRQPVGSGVQDQSHLVGQRRAATGAVGGQLAVVPA